MAKFKTVPTDYIEIKDNNEDLILIKKEKFESFNETILGLGKIDTKSNQVNALSAIFDLEGFTNFCKQMDPQLAVPEYLSEFLRWLFEQIRMELMDKSYPEGYSYYSDFPFLSKYMGDGVLFIWDTENLSDHGILNIVLSMHNICMKYEKVFYKKISKKIGSPPTKLRCGISRGAIYSVGDGNDYVGPCINMSARLQKLNSLTFCFSRKGLNPEINPTVNELMVVKKTDIRGIGAKELVCILKREYLKLSKEDKAKFLDV